MALDLSRRSFFGGLSAAIAAPYVVRASGVLMPIKGILRSRVVSVLEGSYDQATWNTVLRRVGAGAGSAVPSRELIYSGATTPKFRYYRTVISREWQNVSKETVMPNVVLAQARSRYAKLGVPQDWSGAEITFKPMILQPNWAA